MTCNDVRRRVFAMVPAAGRSERMGRPKQLMAVQGRPMLIRVLDSILAADVERVTVITNQTVCDALELPATSRMRCVFNEDQKSEMIDSIRLGIADLAIDAKVSKTDGILVCPGDLPAVTARDVGTCVAAFRRQPDRIVVALRTGRRGHPIVFPAALMPFVESSACDHGLNALPRAHPERVLEVECQSDGVLHDVDTPADIDAPDLGE